MPESAAARLALPVVVLATLLVALTATAEQAMSEPQTMVHEITLAVSKRLAASQARLEVEPDYVVEIARELVVPHIDFPALAAATLPGSWDALSNGEQRCITRGIKDHLVERYARALLEFEHASIVTDPVHPVAANEPIYVTQTVTTPYPQPLSVKYKLRLIGGKWKVVDLIVVEVSLVTNYRLTFADEIKEQGIGDFLRNFAQCRER